MKRTFIKICGLSTAEAVQAAVTAGADAVGFVFAESPRRVGVDQARELVRTLPATVRKVAVMRHPEAALVQAVLERFQPDWLQTDVEDLEAIELPAACTALPVYRNAQLPDDAQLPAKLLFEGETSGSGRVADWDLARRLSARTQVVLAGGLDATNVREAIAHVAPWGVDVSSGVESARGIKDTAKIHEFVARIRAMEIAS